MHWENLFKRGGPGDALLNEPGGGPGCGRIWCHNSKFQTNEKPQNTPVLYTRESRDYCLRFGGYIIPTTYHQNNPLNEPSKIPKLSKTFAKDLAGTRKNLILESLGGPGARPSYQPGNTQLYVLASRYGSCNEVQYLPFHPPRIVSITFFSGDSWMYPPIPTYPYGKSLYKPYISLYSGCLWVIIPIVP